MGLMKFLRFWFPVACYSVIIFCVSSLPGGPGGISIPKIDKILHLIEYIPFGFLLSSALEKTFIPINSKKLLFFVFLGSFIYGFSDEMHQFFVPFRETSAWDMVADSLGGALGGWFYVSLNKRKK